MSQKWIALNKANQVRTDRSCLKKDLKTGSQALSDLILETPEYLSKVSILTMLTWMPKVGESRAKKIARRLVFTDTLTLNDLSPQTREELARRVANVEVPKLEVAA